MDVLHLLLAQNTSTMFLISDELIPLQIHRAKKEGFSGYFTTYEPPRSLIHAILNPSLRRFWMPDNAKIQQDYLPNFNKYFQLTDREREIFPLLADGMSYKEVGYRLGITGKTVLSHRERLMKKMDFDSNTSLVREAIKLGIISL